ncbi:MAG: hypothetical protein CL596_02100, partial [Alteromonas sp.]|nr:hypothetical protein [Alteromonas sp.]
LYQFQNLRQKLREFGFPEIDVNSGYKAIRTDFNKAYKDGKIVFKEDGIYLVHEGNEYRGYMYMPTYRVSEYNSYSRFHLTRCSTIDNFISRGMFNTFYKWSNHKTNDIEDRDTKETHEEITLKLCSNCQSEIFDGINDTEDFFETLETSDLNQEHIQVGINGYVKEKEKISKHYRQKKMYKCESCCIQPKQRFHNRWWHVHHINGDKLFNNESNLQCLCIVCHAFNDKRHEENFSRKRMVHELKSFYDNYKTELEEIQNPYFDRIEYFIEENSRQ